MVFLLSLEKNTAEAPGHISRANSKVFKRLLPESLYRTPEKDVLFSSVFPTDHPTK